MVAPIKLFLKTDTVMSGAKLQGPKAAYSCHSLLPGGLELLDVTGNEDPRRRRFQQISV